MAAGSRPDGEMLAEINVTPLVDVVLVLLVVLMVAATALATRSITVEVPKARTGESAEAKSEPLVVSIDAGGAMFLDAVPADDHAITERVRARRRAGTDAASAVVAADGRTRHDAVVRVLDLLRTERIAKIAIVVRREPEAR
jgi:biopolymer transport protein ExbD